MATPLAEGKMHLRVLPGGAHRNMPHLLSLPRVRNQSHCPALKGRWQRCSYSCKRTCVGPWDNDDDRGTARTRVFLHAPCIEHKPNVTWLRDGGKVSLHKDYVELL